MKVNAGRSPFLISFIGKDSPSWRQRTRRPTLSRAGGTGEGGRKFCGSQNQKILPTCILCITGETQDLFVSYFCMILIHNSSGDSAEKLPATMIELMERLSELSDRTVDDDPENPFLKGNKFY